MKIPYIINIQRFSVHDGAGIRTTVFFKGCPLSCAWCHNPESQRYTPELMEDSERCTGCGACIPVCPQKAVAMTADGYVKTDRTLCKVCGLCVDRCIHNARDIVGVQYPVQVLVEKLLRDQMFYETSDGGVTLSGGEVMVQDIDYITDVVKRLYREEISVNIDTCGEAPYESFRAILPYVDYFLYDLKAITPELHQRWTGKDNHRILENLKQLSADGAKINLRLPIVGVNSTDDEVDQLINFVRQNLQIAQINLLPYHKVGSDKGERLGRNNTILFAPPSSERMETLRQKWQNAGIAPVLIGG